MDTSAAARLPISCPFTESSAARVAAAPPDYRLKQSDTGTKNICLIIRVYIGFLSHRWLGRRGSTGCQSLVITLLMDPNWYKLHVSPLHWAALSALSCHNASIMCATWSWASSGRLRILTAFKNVWAQKITCRLKRWVAKDEDFYENRRLYAEECPHWVNVYLSQVANWDYEARWMTQVSPTLDIRGSVIVTAWSYFNYSNGGSQLWDNCHRYQIRVRKCFRRVRLSCV